MNYKQYIINMILSLDNTYNKMHLYTLQVRDLVYIKDDLLTNDNVKIK